MSFHRIAFAALFAAVLPGVSWAQSDSAPSEALSVELNTAQNVGNACRLTFVVQNGTGVSIDKAVFETVIFDTEGGVVSLSLFDFRDLPADRPRVRQFDLPGRDCAQVGRALINGANTCVVDGADSTICRDMLSLSSRVKVELLG